MKRRLRRWTVEAGVLLLVLGLGGFLVAASGIIPIKASAGHWPITEWFLQFGKRRSTATHTLGMDLPNLDDRALVLRGAGHYEHGCRPCHGSPDLRSPRIAAAMTPAPPYLPPRMAHLDPEELFYIVKHGIKFTGMPAWPSQNRDDEVLAVVAFLLELPKLDAASYRSLVDGDAPLEPPLPPLQDLPEPPRVPRAVAASCARCHGADGTGRGTGAFPKLAGQRQDYLVRALEAYSDGRRHSGTMGPIAAALGRQESRELARYYSNLPRGLTGSMSPERPPPSSDPRLRRGEEIAAHGLPSEGVPSCMDCHGPGPQRRNPAYPNLAGQYANYLVLQLELFEQDSRGGSAYAPIMRHVATRLSPHEMREVAAYYESLSPGPDRTAP
jgi:cytochrome c553